MFEVLVDLSNLFQKPFVVRVISCAVFVALTFERAF